MKQVNRVNVPEPSFSARSSRHGPRPRQYQKAIGQCVFPYSENSFTFCVEFYVDRFASKRSGPKSAIDTLCDRRLLELNIEHLGGNPLTDMTDLSRASDQLCNLPSHVVSLADQLCKLLNVVHLFARSTRWKRCVTLNHKLNPPSRSS